MTADATALYNDPTVHARRWWILATLCTGVLVVFMNNSALNVAIPTLSRELHATSSELQWTVAIYSLVFAGLLFTTGALGDRFGRKGILQIGFGLFLLTAVMTSQADEMWQIITGRAVMGLAAACVLPATLSIVVNVFPPGERGKAIAIWAAVTGFAGTIGPLASGFLLDHFWYGSVFLANVPILAIAFIGTARLVPKSRDPQEARIDVGGAVLSTIGVGVLVYSLIEAPHSGWLGSSTLLSLGVAVVALVAFVFWERRTDHPMLDMTYFRNRSFSTGSGGMVMIFMTMYGTIFVVIQFLQLVQGYGPFEAAVRGMPFGITIILVAPFTPRITARFGVTRTVVAGMLILGSGMFLLRFLEVDSAYLFVVACVILTMVGIALAMPPMTAAVMSGVPTRRAGAGSAMNDATRELGGALGIAVIGSIAASQYSNEVAPALTTLSAQARSAAEGSLAGGLRVAASVPGAAGRALTASAKQSFVDGVHLAGLVGAGFAVISAVIVLRYLPRSSTGRAPVEETGEDLPLADGVVEGVVSVGPF
jgi:EmrB/QacA subfamily drug resistance transporter